MNKEYDLKDELEKRNISVDELRFFEAYSLANFITEKTVDDITDWLIDGSQIFFNLSDPKFLKATENVWNQMKDIEYWYTKHLDELQEIIYREDKPRIIEKEINPRIIDESKLKLWIEKQDTKKRSNLRIWFSNEISLKEFKEIHKEKWTGIILKEVCIKCNSENIIIIKEKMIHAHGEIYPSGAYPLAKCLDCGCEMSHDHYCKICLEAGEDGLVCLKCSEKYTMEEINKLISISNLNFDLGEDLEVNNEIEDKKRK